MFVIGLILFLIGIIYFIVGFFTENKAMNISIGAVIANLGNIFVQIAVLSLN